MPDLLKQVTNELALDSVELGDHSKALDKVVHANFPLVTELEHQELKRSLSSSTISMGFVDELLAREDITEILISGPNRVWVEVNGDLKRVAVEITEEEIRRIIERIVVPLGERIDSSCPVVDARLRDGSRVHAIIPPLAIDGSCLSIRKFARRSIKVDDFCARKIGEFVEYLAFGRFNLLIAGATSAGKTTFLGAAAGFIPAQERIVTVEDSAELQIRHPHVVRLESRRANGEGIGEVTLRELVRQSLRMRPDRLVVGEFRGAEAFDVLQAMNTGHDGSMTTCHANSPVDALRRVESMALTAGVGLSAESVRHHIISVIDFVVFLRRTTGGKRVVDSISEVGNDIDDTRRIVEGDSFVGRVSRLPRTHLVAAND